MVKVDSLGFLRLKESKLGLFIQERENFLNKNGG